MTRFDCGEVITAMVTPMNAKGEIDYDAAEKLAKYLVDNGSDALLVAGTTGESPTLTNEEERELVSTVKHAVANKAKIILSAGSNCTKTAVEFSKNAQKEEADAILSVVPYYNKPNQLGLLQHFESIAKATGNITIDGDLSEWDNLGAHDVSFIGYSFADNTRTSKEAVADHFQIKKFKLTYKDDGIYMAYDIMDNKVKVDQIDQFWYEDCVEVLATNVIDKPTADLQVYCKEDGGDTIQFAMAPTWQYTVANVRSSANAMQHKADIQVKVVMTEDGYRGECFLPFTVVPSWAISIANHEQIDMALVVGDGKRDDEGLARLQAGNVPHFVENYKTMTNSMPQYFFE